MLGGGSYSIGLHYKICSFKQRADPLATIVPSESFCTYMKQASAVSTSPAGQSSVIICSTYSFCNLFMHALLAMKLYSYGLRRLSYAVYI